MPLPKPCCPNCFLRHDQPCWKDEIDRLGTVVTDPFPMPPPRESGRTLWVWTPDEVHLYQLFDTEGERIYVRYVDGPLRSAEPPDDEEDDIRAWHVLFEYKQFNWPGVPGDVLDFLFHGRAQPFVRPDSDEADRGPDGADCDGEVNDGGA